MSFGILSQEVEGIRHFAFIFEYVNTALRHDFGRELRFTPADVQRSDHVIEQVRRYTAGVIPVLAETEEPVRLVSTIVRQSVEQPPVYIVIALCIRAGLCIALPVPLAIVGIATI